MNYSEDSRIDDFCRELALALRRITGLIPDTIPSDLPRQATSQDNDSLILTGADLGDKVEENEKDEYNDE